MSKRPKPESGTLAQLLKRAFPDSAPLTSSAYSLRGVQDASVAADAVRRRAAWWRDTQGAGRFPSGLDAHPDDTAPRLVVDGSITAFDEVFSIAAALGEAPRTNDPWAQHRCARLAHAAVCADLLGPAIEQGDGALWARLVQRLPLMFGAAAWSRACADAAETLYTAARAAGRNAFDEAARRTGVELARARVLRHGTAHATRAAELDQALRGPLPHLTLPVGALDQAEVDLALGWNQEIGSAALARLNEHARAGSAWLLEENPETDAPPTRDQREQRSLAFAVSRLLSARCAELLVAECYRTWLGADSVVDVSRLQRTSPSDSRWRTHDLEVGGKPLDVKSAWCTQGRPHVYSTHFVKRLKTTAQRCPVWVAGVFAPTARPGDLIRSPDSVERSVQRSVQGLRFLGITSARRMAAYRDAFLIPGRFEPDLPADPGDRELHLPAWVFELSPAATRARDETLAGLRGDALPDATWAAAARWSPLPALLAAGVDPSTTWARDALTSWTRGFVADWLPVRARFGLQLPALYLSLLRYVLTAPPPSDVGSALEELRSILFAGDVTRPLGLADPLEQITSLIATLALVLQELARMESPIVCFRLVGTRILRGRPLDTPPDEERTLVAYCYACGAWPLVLGQHPPCSYHHLTCDCGKCCYRHDLGRQHETSRRRHRLPVDW